MKSGGEKKLPIDPTRNVFALKSTKLVWVFVVYHTARSRLGFFVLVHFLEKHKFANTILYVNVIQNHKKRIRDFY